MRYSLTVFLGGDATGQPEGFGTESCCGHIRSRSRMVGRLDPRVSHLSAFISTTNGAMSSVGTWGMQQVFRTYRKWKLYLNLIRMILRNFERRWKADLGCTTTCTAGLVVQCLIFRPRNDPIFALNHANIDRLWALWQSYGHHGESHYPDSGEPYGHNLQDSDVGRGMAETPAWVDAPRIFWNLIPRTVDDARTRSHH